MTLIACTISRDEVDAINQGMVAISAPGVIHSQDVRGT
jgi:hypothetical protein